MYQHQLTTLKNGLKLITTPMPQVESLTVMVGVGAGSRYETRWANGIFHFLEHMAFKGTKKRPTALKISSVVDGVGGEFNAFTGKELTGYHIRLAAQHQELAFDILSDILTNSLFSPAEIEKEKGVIVEEINVSEDTPTHKVMEEFLSLLFGDNPMGWKIAGTLESVRSIKRPDFINYMNRFYFPVNMVVAVAGKPAAAITKKLAQKYFGPLGKMGQKPKKPLKLDQKKARVNLIHKKTEQAHLCLGVPGYSYVHPDRFALGVLATVLGGGMSSRIFTEIREKRGLAYYAYVVPDFYTDTGFLMARAGVRLQKVDAAVEVILNLFQETVAKKVTEKELTKAKEYLKGHLILALEDSWRVASRYAGQTLLEDKIRTPQETIKLIDKVTAEDVQRVAKDIFKQEKLNLALIGPYKSKTRFSKLLI